jgi:hypothetical protein
MIDKFKKFFKNFKKDKVDEVPFDPETSNEVIHSIVYALNDLKGVSVYRSNRLLPGPDAKFANFVRENPQLFRIKYHVNLKDDVDLEELKLEILNCQSHLESEGFTLGISVYLPSVPQSTRNPIDLDNLTEIRQNGKLITDRFTIQVYPSEGDNLFRKYKF